MVCEFEERSVWRAKKQKKADERCTCIPVDDRWLRGCCCARVMQCALHALHLQRKDKATVTSQAPAPTTSLFRQHFEQCQEQSGAQGPAHLCLSFQRFGLAERLAFQPPPVACAEAEYIRSKVSCRHRRFKLAGHVCQASTAHAYDIFSLACNTKRIMRPEGTDERLPTHLQT